MDAFWPTLGPGIEEQGAWLCAWLHAMATCIRHTARTRRPLNTPTPRTPRVHQPPAAPANSRTSFRLCAAQVSRAMTSRYFKDLDIYAEADVSQQIRI